jgi:hypothetical protein
MNDGFISGTLPANTQNSQDTGIHKPDGFRTHNTSKRVAESPSLELCGTWIDDLEYRNANHGIFTHEIKYYRR